MNLETQKALRWFSVPVAMGIAVPALFFIFRFTAVAAFIVFLLLCISLPLHGSRRTLHVAFAVFVTAILIPIDVYVPGWNLPLRQSTPVYDLCQCFTDSEPALKGMTRRF